LQRSFITLRINFFKSVSESASTAYSPTLEKEEPIPEARKELIESLDKLMDLRKSHRSELFPKVITVFDEASAIPKSLYYAICRGLRDIDKFPIWTFFLLIIVPKTSLLLLPKHSLLL